MQKTTLIMLALLTAACNGKSGPASPQGSWYVTSYTIDGTEHEMPDLSSSDNIKLDVESDDSGAYSTYRFNEYTEDGATITELESLDSYTITGSFDAASSEYTFEVPDLGEAWLCLVEYSELECIETLGDAEQIMILDSGSPTEVL